MYSKHKKHKVLSHENQKKYDMWKQLTRKYDSEIRELKYNRNNGEITNDEYRERKAILNEWLDNEATEKDIHVLDFE